MFTVSPPNPAPAPAAAADGRVRQGDVPRVDSGALLGPRGEVHIAHHGQVYRLRVTSLGKLILTK